MQEKLLPNVHKRKIWIVLAIAVALAFFLLWALPGGNTPAVLESGDAPPVTTGP